MKKKVETLDMINTDPINTPLIFKKKQKRSLIKTLDYIHSDTGKIRHYPPAAQE